MADEAQLLRMLEPAVRPAGTPHRTAAPTPAIEDRPFDQMLAEAAARPDGPPEPSANPANRTPEPTGNTETTTPDADDRAPDLLEHLGRLGLTARRAAARADPRSALNE